VGSGNFIDRYEYLPLGLTARNYEVKDIVHIKHGVDPLNTRLGFSRSARILRHIATDNSISTAAAALMRNGGLLGLMISPEGESIVPEDQIEKLIELGKSKITGERSGEPWVHSLPLKVEQIGYAPKDMSFNDIIQVPEERIAASFGIPITVLQLHAGLQRTSENNVGEAKREAYEGGLCTRWDRLGKVLTRQLLTQFGDDPETMRVRFDYSKIPALQEDVTARHSRARENWLAGGMTLNEYRQEIGLPSLDEDEGDRFRGDSSTDSNETDDTKDKNDE
jgi:HK97 family phage portal protein